MKIVIQRVQSASVVIEDSTVGAIKQGLLLLVGVGPEDTKEDIDYVLDTLKEQVPFLRQFTRR